MSTQLGQEYSNNNKQSNRIAKQQAATAVFSIKSISQKHFTVTVVAWNYELGAWLRVVHDWNPWTDPPHNSDMPLGEAGQFGHWRTVNVSWLFWRATYHEWEMVFRHEQRHSLGPASVFLNAEVSGGRALCVVYFVFFTNIQ